MGWRTRVWLATGVSSLVFVSAGVAGAESIGDTSTRAGEVSTLEARVEGQDASLRSRIDEVSAVGAELEEAQVRVDGARDRAGDLRDQSREIEQEISVQREAYSDSKARYEEKARAAYKGSDLDGLASLLDGTLRSGDAAAIIGDSGVVRVLLEGRDSLEAYRESMQTLQSTTRQVSQIRRDYEKALEDERTTTEDLRRREEQLDRSIMRISASKSRAETRLRELAAAEKARILEARPASGGGGVDRGSEMRVSREEITVRPVAPISKKAYRKLYMDSARGYGFGRDWYVLAAVGKVESDHGENMGPSSAGALGPMQFLPSTWKTSGVDGNGDGVANVMDPRDAIPAAARYLKVGGAPRDWYGALYSYNHADWYVKKVLAVAEGYRRLERDDRVRPYS